MNGDQVTGIIRAIMSAFAGWAIAHGFSNEQWLAITGGLSAALAVAWSFYSNSNNSMLNKVADNPEVNRIVVNPGAVFTTNNPKVTAQ